MTGFYGEAPVDLGELALPDWTEFMHYLYLPVRLPDHEDRLWGGDVVVPARLEFLRGPIYRVLADLAATLDTLPPGPMDDPYVYVTVRRGYATPGNPLNRPGWHCDDFGGTDLNYIWSDVYPTQILRSEKPLWISDGDRESMADMERHAETAAQRSWHQIPSDLRIEDAPVGHLLRLSPYVIHDTPSIPEPGGMRSFFKISVSTCRYDLVGNSHNHLLDYDWPMVDRQAVRNQPAVGNLDHSVTNT